MNSDIITLGEYLENVEDLVTDFEDTSLETSSEISGGKGKKRGKSKKSKKNKKKKNKKKKQKKQKKQEEGDDDSDESDYDDSDDDSYETDSDDYITESDSDTETKYYYREEMNAQIANINMKLDAILGLLRR
jgi:hypothetical protein